MSLIQFLNEMNDSIWWTVKMRILSHSVTPNMTKTNTILFARLNVKNACLALRLIYNPTFNKQQRWFFIFIKELCVMWRSRHPLDSLIKGAVQSFIVFCRGGLMWPITRTFLVDLFCWKSTLTPNMNRITARMSSTCATELRIVPWQWNVKSTK